MADSTTRRSSTTIARADARVLLRRLRREVKDALITAQELQVPLNEVARLSFEGGRIRGVIDQLQLVSRTAHQVLKDLEEQGGEVADG